MAASIFREWVILLFTGCDSSCHDVERALRRPSLPLGLVQQRMRALSLDPTSGVVRIGLGRYRACKVTSEARTS